ncbi:hypothetical protein SAMN04487866_102117 [Thermoactinomyces sp. DSM 45891]|uniref:hypothetical protein n=1 Tax=Thermoactinomyces sp. DSM 45891 TaxID=1761907 RepID=UPI000917D014|nr:hypothetical protein [Thermoactinomyces sp. DSM 45891]SFX19734.1 hypothetical protein SAMN04487866_102117 [Thermoactinomyces sp. DSM 45891]
MNGERYLPRIQEASIPEDGVWATYLEKPVLFLSIPEWLEVIESNDEATRFVWMFDREQDAYLFCFQCVSGQEYAIAFPKEHAGMLLRDERSYDLFSLFITSKELEEVTESSNLLQIHDISLQRHPKAGW